MKARWHKYYSEMDRMMDHLNKEYKKGCYTVDEYNEIEQKIYTDFDKADDIDYFDEVPDEE